jgi:hypothetical protein
LLFRDSVSPVPSPLPERRASPRHSVPLPLQIVRRGGSIEKAVAANVSAGGLFFYSCSRKIEVEAVVGVRLEGGSALSPLFPARGVSLHGTGRVIRVVPGPARARAVAVRFLRPLAPEV